MPSPSANAGSRRPFRAPAAIFWTGFLLRVAAILIGHTYRIRLNGGSFDFGYEAGRIARSVVTGHGYGNPFNGFSGPTAWLPPLFPLLLALGFKLFGVYSRGAALFIMGLDSLFSALIGPAIYEIAARCFDVRGLARRQSQKLMPVALWSGWFWALYPAAMQYAVHWVWEMSLTACLFTWALVLALRLRGVGDPPAPPRPHTGLWLLWGLLWGFIALSNASLLLMFGGSLLWILWPQRGVDLRRTFPGQALHAALACLVFAAVLAPWVVRNEYALHAFIPTRANFGVEFWHSTEFDRWGAIPWGVAMPLAPHDPEFQRYVTEGEVHYAREKAALAKTNIRRRPGAFVRNTLLRTQFFWFGTPAPVGRHPILEYLRILQFSATSLCGLLGFGLMWRHRVPGWSLFGLAFFLVPLVYYAVTAQARFRHPLEPLLTIAGIYLFRCTQPRRPSAAARH